MYEVWLDDGTDSAAARFWHPDIEYLDDPRWPGGGTHTGRDAVAARFDEVTGVLGIRAVSVDRVAEAGPQVAWVIHAHGESPGAGVPNDHEWGYVGKIVDARLVYFRAYYDADEAMKAVGQRQRR
jgi:hypothetical protein